LKALKELVQSRASGLRIEWDAQTGQPIFLRLRDYRSPQVSQRSFGKMTALEKAWQFLEENAALFRLKHPRQEFRLWSVTEDKLGMTHVRLQQIYEGLDMWGRDLYVHMGSEGKIVAVNGRVAPTLSFPDSWPPDPQISSETALEVVRRDLKIPKGHSVQEELQLLLFPLYDSTSPLAKEAGRSIWRLSWYVHVRFGLEDNWEYFVDALSGEILHKANRICPAVSAGAGPVPGSGRDLHGQIRTLNVYELNGVYYMIDASKPMFRADQSQIPDKVVGGIVTLDAHNGRDKLYYVTSTDPNNWAQANAVSAAANGALVYDYYSQIHGRNSIDGNGGSMYQVINFDRNYNNAFWNGQLMVFGTGDGQNFSDLAGALDVHAHEMTHGVVEHTANLIYENQPGALNESFADVFGVMVEFFYEGTQGDWLLGEDITTPGVPGDALRDMENPASDKVAFGGQQPTRMSEYRNLPNTEEGDHGGVHINSGIPNRACYLVAQAIGIQKTERIYYRALAHYLTRSSQFVDARLALTQAAADLYGDQSSEVQAVKSAFDAVEIYEGPGGEPPPELPPVEGSSWIAAIDASDGSLWRISADLQQVQQLTTTAVSNRPTITDDGRYILFIDGDHNVRIIQSDGQGEQVLSQQGIFSSIAISPNAAKLALTTIYMDTTIYILDLTDPTGSSDRAYRIYSPTYTPGERAGTALFADALDWASDSQHLMYDAYNLTFTETGDTLDYWDINILRASDGLIARLFPPQPQGVSIGNPVFASNKDFIIAFDYVDENWNVSVLGANLETGDVGQITYNYQSLGRPTFTGDDRAVIYQYVDYSGASLWQVSLQADGITGAGDDQQIVTGGTFPVWFTIGSRAPVEDHPAPPAVPTELVLHPNYPNPFPDRTGNPATHILFELPRPSYIRVIIFDQLGRRVTQLAEGWRPAGRYTLRWDGTNQVGQSVANGIYFLRLIVRDGRSTRQLSQKMVLLR